MRSVVVVLPASMWAIMPMFRVFSSEYCLAKTSSAFDEAPSPFSLSHQGRGVGVRGVYTIERLTSDSGRMPYLHLPCGAHLPSFLLPRRCCSMHREFLRRAFQPWIFPAAATHTSGATETPGTTSAS